MQQTIKQDFTAFYNANYTKINAHMRKKKSGLDPAVCEDLVQEAWVKMYKLYTPEMETPIALITRLVNNELYSHVKKLSVRNTQVIGESQYSILDKDPYEQAAEKESMEKALMQLPYEMYKPLYMFRYEGYKYEEIAEKLQIPLGTVKHRIHMAMNKLRIIINH